MLTFPRILLCDLLLLHSVAAVDSLDDVQQKPKMDAPIQQPLPTAASTKRDHNSLPNCEIALLSQQVAVESSPWRRPAP